MQNIPRQKLHSEYQILGTCQVPKCPLPGTEYKCSHVYQNSRCKQNAIMVPSDKAVSVLGKPPGKCVSPDSTRSQSQCDQHWLVPSPCLTPLKNTASHYQEQSSDPTMSCQYRRNPCKLQTFKTIFITTTLKKTH